MKTIPPVKEIVKAYLKEHGYDGLRSYFCGCDFEVLMDCDSCGGNCEPGYKWMSCDKCPDVEDCAIRIDEPDWCIRPDKPERSK